MREELLRHFLLLAWFLIYFCINQDSNSINKRFPGPHLLDASGCGVIFVFYSFPLVQLSLHFQFALFIPIPTRRKWWSH